MMDTAQALAHLKNRAAMLRLGRGWSIPPRIVEGGGMAWNIPTQPTYAELKAAAEAAMQEAIATPYGSIILDRGAGTILNQILQSSISQKKRILLDRFVASCQSSLSDQCPYLSFVPPGEAISADFIPEMGKLVVSVMWTFIDVAEAGGNAPSISFFALGSAGVVEVLSV